MTISNPVSSALVQGNGVTTSFAYNFLMPSTASAHLTLYDNTSSGLVLSSVIPTSSFTVNNVGVTAGGTFTYPLTGSPVSTGQSLVFERIVPIVQDTSIANQGRFAPQATEGALDYLTMIAQQQQDQLDALAEDVANLPSVTPSTSILQINVQDFGATGNGTTDDSAAINAAFAFLRVQQAISPYYTNVGYEIYFPAGNYSCGTTINGTGFYNILNWGIKGPGKIIGHTTGQPVLDLTDSRWYHVADIFIRGDATHIPTIGALLARGPFGFCDVTLWDNVTIDGYFSKACLFNYASEDSHFTKCLFTNFSTSTTSYCMAQDGTNFLGASSPYLTLATGSQSFNNNTALTCEFRNNGGGVALFLNRTAGHKYLNCYAVSTGSAAISVYTPSASDATVDLELRVHCETNGATSCVRFDGTASQTIYGFKFSDHYLQTATTVFQTGSGVTSVILLDVDIHLPLFQAAMTTAGIFNTTGSFSVYGGQLSVGDATKLRAIANMNCTVYTDNRASASFGPGTQIVFDKTNLNVAVFGQFAATTGSFTTPSYSFNGDSNTGMYSPAADTLALATAGAPVLYVTPTGQIGIGQQTGGRKLVVKQIDATNSGVSSLFLIDHETSGAPSNGIGVGMDFQIQTPSGFPVGATFNAVCTDTTTASEDFDFVFNLIGGGAAIAERGRLSSTGIFTAQNEIRASGDTGGAASKNTLTNGSDVTTNSSGVGSIKFKGATSRDSLGFIKMYVGTTPVFIPVFSAITG